MKFIIEKSAFMEALSKASRASAARSNIPVLEGVLISAKGDNLTFVGYDLEMGIRCITDLTELTEEGSMVVNAKILGDIIKKMPSGLIEFSTDGDKFITRSGKIRSAIAGMSGDDYPNLPILKGKPAFEIEESVLKSVIRQTIHAVALTDIKPVLMGVKFHIENNMLTVVAADGVRAAKRTEKTDFGYIDFVAPKRALDELMKILSDEPTKNNVQVFIERNQICFSINDYTIISRLLEGSFLNYEKITGFPEKASAVVNALDFAAALDRTLSINLDKMKRPTICTFDNNILHIQLKTNLGDMEEDIPIKYDGERFETAFNAKYMIDALRNSECDEVKLDFTAAMQPIRISPLSGADYVAIVLPVRIKQVI